MSNKNARDRLRAQQALQAAKKKRRHRIIAIAIAVVVVVAIVVTVVVVANRPAPIAAAPGQAQTIAGQPPDANSDDTGIIVNPGKAAVDAPLVSIYLDYQCPMCHQLEETFGAEFESLAASGQIQLQYRTLTFLDQNLHNDSSSRAAIAAACADSAGVYAAYHDQVFANQPEQEGAGYTDALLTQTIPDTIGLTGDKLQAFQQCYANRTPEAFVNAVDEAGSRDNVQSTPTVRVNGQDLDMSGIDDPSKLGPAIMAAAAAPADAATPAA